MHLNHRNIRSYWLINHKKMELLDTPNHWKVRLRRILVDQSQKIGITRHGKSMENEDISYYAFESKAYTVILEIVSCKGRGK